MHLLLEALECDDADARYTAVIALRRAAREGKDIGIALEKLESVFDDMRFPSDRSECKNPALAIGCEAAGAVAAYHLKRCQVTEWRAIAARDDWPGRAAIWALRGSATPDEIAPFVPFLRDALRSADGPLAQGARWSSRRSAAASALAWALWLRKDWVELRSLIHHANEDVRLATLRALDDLAEDEQDVDAVLPEIIALFSRREGEWASSRRAAAEVLAWFVLRSKKRSRKVLVSGTDVLKIPEVRDVIREQRAWERRFRDES